jgi:hypothetical protein
VVGQAFSDKMPTTKLQKPGEEPGRGFYVVFKTPDSLQEVMGLSFLASGASLGLCGGGW